MGWQYSFWQSFRRLFFCAGQRAFLGQLRALKGQSRTEDLVVKEILRRIYFKFGFDSSTPCLLLSGSNLDASLTLEPDTTKKGCSPRHSPDSPTPPDSTRNPTSRQPDSTDSTCKRVHVLTDRQPRQPPTLHRPTPPDTTPTPSDDTRHHPKTRQPPSRKGLRGREAENARRGVRKVQHLARAGVRNA